MTRLSFRYSIRIDFDSPVSNHSFLLRCCPQSDNRQIISELDITLEPKEDIWQSRDGFGNLYISGSVRAAHERFEAVVTGKALTGMTDVVPSEKELRENIFKYYTRLTRPDQAILDVRDEILRQLKTENIDTADPVIVSDKVMDYLDENMSYVPGTTFVDTTAAMSFEKRQGVCQDYAHIMLSMLRSLKICARYVVGMMEGEGFSHAWVEVRHNGLWYGFDPTNHTRVTDKYIKMSHGRDYEDCMINVGCMTGNAMQTTYVSANVEEVME